MFTSNIEKSRASDAVLKAIRDHRAWPAGQEIKNETTFAGDLGFDSLDAVELVMNVEDELDIEISDHELQDLVTVGQLIDVVSRSIGREAQGI